MKERRFELRCTDEELAAWRGRAAEESMSVSRWLREVAQEAIPEGYPAAALRQAPPPSPPESIAALARRRHAHLPLQFAERKVREELG